MVFLFVFAAYPPGRYLRRHCECNCLDSPRYLFASPGDASQQGRPLCYQQSPMYLQCPSSMLSIQDRQLLLGCSQVSPVFREVERFPANQFCHIFCYIHSPNLLKLCHKEDRRTVIFFGALLHKSSHRGFLLPSLLGLARQNLQGRFLQGHLRQAMPRESDLQQSFRVPAWL